MRLGRTDCEHLKLPLGSSAYALLSATNGYTTPPALFCPTIDGTSLSSSCGRWPQWMDVTSQWAGKSAGRVPQPSGIFLAARLTCCSTSQRMPRCVTPRVIQWASFPWLHTTVCMPCRCVVPLLLHSDHSISLSSSYRRPASLQCLRGWRHRLLPPMGCHSRHARHWTWCAALRFRETLATW